MREEVFRSLMAAEQQHQVNASAWAAKRGASTPSDSGNLAGSVSTEESTGTGGGKGPDPNSSIEEQL